MLLANDAVHASLQQGESADRLMRLGSAERTAFLKVRARYLLYEGALGLPRAGLAVMWAEGQLPKPRRRAAVEGES